MFYGSDVYANGTLRKSKSDEPIFSLNETMWKHLNEINVEQFLHDTRPSFSLHLCHTSIIQAKASSLKS